MKRKLIAVLLAALVAQIWGTLSWTVLPWHQIDFKTFQSESAVVDALKAQLKGSGIYLLPNFDESHHGDPAAMEQWGQKARSGPFAFMSVQAEGVDPGMGIPMLINFFTNLVTAALILWMLAQTTLNSVLSISLFSSVAGGLGSLYPHLSNWAWWHMPASYCFVGFIDLFVTWGLAGLMIAKICRRFPT